MQTDVADSRQADALIMAAVDDHGRLDVLVNNAGVQVEKTIVATSDTDFDRVIDVNVRGVFNCARAAAREMLKQGGGSIRNSHDLSCVLTPQRRAQSRLLRIVDRRTVSGLMKRTGSERSRKRRAT